MSISAIIESGARDLGLPVAMEQVDALIVYLAELQKWNRKMNLTAIRDDHEIAVKHFLDSLSYAKGFSPAEGTTLLDIGSGAGFPGLPLKVLFPPINVALVEASKKKATFLRHIIRTLRLEGVEVIDKRTEELPDSFNGRFDVATARAFASLDKVLAEGARFIRPGGVMVLSRGPEEMISGPAAEAAGFEIAGTEKLVLPHSTHARSLWVFRRKGQG